MISRNKYGLIVVALLLLYGIYYFNSKDAKLEQQGNLTQVEKKIPVEAENMGMDAIAIDDSAIAEKNVTKPLPSPVEQAKHSPNPFSNVKQDISSTEEDVVEEKKSNENSNEDVIVNMPASYPIEEADKYFLPPEERRSGHIGGPPPLSFPKVEIK